MTKPSGLKVYAAVTATIVIVGFSTILHFSEYFVPVNMESHFARYGDELFKLEAFVRSKYPLSMEFVDENRLNVIMTDTSGLPGKNLIIEGWDVPRNDEDVLYALNSKGWATNDIDSAFYFLRSANCRSFFYLDNYARVFGASDLDVESVVEIGVGTALFRRYVYVIYDRPLTREAMKHQTYMAEPIRYLDERVGWTKLSFGSH